MIEWICDRCRDLGRTDCKRLSSTRGYSCPGCRQGKRACSFHSDWSYSPDKNNQLIQHKEEVKDYMEEYMDKKFKKLQVHLDKTLAKQGRMLSAIAKHLKVEPEEWEEEPDTSKVYKRKRT